MSKHYEFSLEPLVNLKLDKNRFQVKQCPCGKSNKDGKFVPFKDFEDRGYCHSCGIFRNVAKHICPGCKKEQAFSKYVDTQSPNLYLNEDVGKCLYCSYHYSPKQFFADNKAKNDKSKEQPKTKKNLRKPEFSYILKKANLTKPFIQPNKVRPVGFIPTTIFKESLKHYTKNNFISFLCKQFGSEITGQIISKYFIGTSRHWPGANVFWQINSDGKISAGKIMLYNAETGKRIKEPCNYITWIHTALKLPEYELKQCFFGEHLLHGNTKPVAIVESEKTALIASIYLPQLIWVAAGGKAGLNEDKCQALKGRMVILFPDLNGFEKWRSKAKELSHIAHFTISDLLERKASKIEKEQGLDLADYLVRFNYKVFTSPKSVIATNQPSIIQPLVKSDHFEAIEPSCSIKKPVTPKPENWEKDLNQLEQYFAGIIPPTKPIKLNRSSTITNISLFIESHFATVKASNGKRTFLPYLSRLQQLKQVLTKI